MADAFQFILFGPLSPVWISILFIGFCYIVLTKVAESTIGLNRNGRVLINYISRAAGLLMLMDLYNVNLF